MIGLGQVSGAQGLKGQKIGITSPGSQSDTALRWLAEQLRNEYVVGFQPTTGEQKAQHKVEVILNKDSGSIASGGQRRKPPANSSAVCTMTRWGQHKP